jgi:penicillin-binding protein 2
MTSTARPDQNSRARILYAAAVLLFAVLGLRLFYLQVTAFRSYARESDKNRIAQRRVKASRGQIYASGGEALALNQIIYTVALERSTRSEYEAAATAVRAALGDSAVDGIFSRYQRVIRLKRDVGLRTVAVVEERLKPEHPALSIEIEAQRSYPYRSTCAHLLGYMGIVQDEHLSAPTGRAYVPDDFVGKTGLEKRYEDSLRGTDGIRFVEVDAIGQVRQEYYDREQPAEPGQDLRLTIDLDVQRAAEAALSESESGSGAVVALDPRTGAVLALASKPDFDPNVFVSFHAQQQRQTVLSSRTALLNRATNGRYPAGSTLKMIAAIAGLEEGVITPYSTFAGCHGVLPVGNSVFHCLGRHGELNMLQALEVSCNIYYMHLGQRLGMDTWRSYASRFGLGQPTGLLLDPPESAGLLPTKAYYRARGGWAMGHFMNLVIGQGAVLVTPIQMARYVAAIANGGYLVRPYVCGEPTPPVQIDGVSFRTLGIVREAMRRVVHGSRGTGRRARLDGVEVAGKSGTAQGPRDDDDAWFVAFAPFEAPTIAVAAVVEGGGGGGAVAAPVVRAVLAAHFAEDQEEGSAAPAAQDTVQAASPDSLPPGPVSAWALR